ncbi:MAG: seryl-tRNA synthetase [Verrucomicrobiales bacterium]|jgi:seryl-tRNA synthetase
MLDIRLLREQPDEVKTRLLTRDSDSHALVDKVLACDQVRRQCETERQQLQQERNTVSKEIGKLRKNGQDTSEIEASVKKIGESIKSLDEKVLEAETTQRDLLLSIPNLPHEACPVGQDESANPEVRVWGEKPVGGFKDHVTLGAELGLFDFEAGATLSGSGYVVFTGPGARLERALIQFLLDLQTDQHGYTEVSPPIVVRRECMFGTGQLPKFEDDMYGLEDGSFFLAPTAEVPLTNLVREQLLAEADLPRKYTAYTPCFRREAGSAGRESKGLIRMHQFDKVELVQIVHPDQSMTALEELTGHAEKALQLLGLHYRVIELCTGDLGRSSSKTYDLEVWAPGHGGYLEVSSCSAFMDYQARRMQLRYKDAETKKNHFCHTLNGSGLALPRLFVALVETWQQPDGSIKLPEPLHPYFGGATEIR